MLRYIVLAILLGGIYLAGSTQSLVIDGGFEAFSSCPNANGQLSRLTNWTDAVLSSDYMNCAYNGWAPHIGGAFEGTGFAGNATYGDPSGASESFGQFLSTNMVAGQPYRFRLYAKRASTGPNANNCGGVCFYGRTNAPPLAVGSHPSLNGSSPIGCMSTVSNTTWAVFQGYYVPTGNFTFVELTNGTTATSASCLQYIYVDSFSIVPSTLLDGANIRFQVGKEKDEIRVNWGVENERQISRFEVEKKTENTEFTKIASQAAGGLDDYSFIDRQRSGPGYVFYRIHQINLDGSDSYSPVLKVEPGEPESFAVVVSPNPVPQNGALNFTLPEEGRVFWQIYNVAGQLVQENQQMMAAGENSIQLDMANQIPGIYFLKASFQDQTLNSKFMVE
ncbi:MAG: T9SS type A sorting domain-containing protein [Bacteroidia bacterium]|nr:T9SS type A sorting domain-containing protein [Bacteroidia bacterium]